MLMRGRNITLAGDPLQSVTLEHLYRSVSSPAAETANLINQLRIVRTLDLVRYRKLKTQLPYIVCGHYQPPIRRTENFAHTGCFILDLDHLSEKAADIQTIRDLLKADQRVMLLFASPGNDGLKVLMQLSDKCYDAGKFRIFYKLFAREFARQYNLDQVVDERTSDVTRACFMSVDPDVFYNPLAETVDMAKWVDFDNMPGVDDLFREIKQDDRRLKADEKELKADLSDEVLAAIRAKLLPKSRPAKRDVYVPHELADLETRLKIFLEEYPIELERTEAISYGKKVLLKAGLHKAEVNVFYGRKGFSVVATTKSGTNEELAMMCKQLIENMLQN